MILGYLPASFRGVPFHVDEESDEGGRRLAIHELAGAETPVVEDMGRGVKRWQLRAYVSGTIWSPAAMALKAALDAQGPALLVLPWGGPVMARVENGWRLTRVKDRHGLIEFDVTFVEAGLSATPFAVPPAVTVLATLTLALVSTLAEAVRSSGDADGEGRRRGAAAAEAFRRRLVVPEPKSTVFARTADDLVSGAGVASPSAFVRSAGALVRDLGREADPAAVVTAARPLASMHAGSGRIPAPLGDLLPSDDDGVPLVPTAGAVGDVDAAMAGMFLAIAAAASVDIAYPARDAAASARDALAADLDVVGPVAAQLGTAAAEAVGGIVLSAIDDLSRAAASRSPLVRIETGVSMPSTLLAWRLYGDPDAAAMLADRAGSGTPILMPVSIDVPAPTVPVGSA